MISLALSFFFFFFNDAPPAEFSPLPLPDALPIWQLGRGHRRAARRRAAARRGALRRRRGTLRRRRAGAGQSAALQSTVARDRRRARIAQRRPRSEEHTAELQSPCNLVSRLLPEKK